MKVRSMVRAGSIAAIYVTLCLVFAPISYGAIQIRVSEALTLLPIFCPQAIVGVTIGCFIANMLGGTPVDMVIGTLATLLAAIATYRLRSIRWKGLPILASLPPIVFNAVIIGGMISVLTYFPKAPTMASFLFNMLTVGIGQIISVGILGLTLVTVIEKNKVLRQLFVDEEPTKAHK